VSSRAQRRLVRALVAVLVLVLIAVLTRSGVIAPSSPAPTQPAPPPAGGTAALVSGEVSHVYDGDTIEVSGVGKVRLIGIDAMDGYNLQRALSQSRRYGLSVERVKQWADAATEFARQRLRGERVTLHFGPERTDDYGRTLAYVHFRGSGGEDEDFNVAMLKAGLAAAYVDFDHPRRQEYLKAEAEAQAARAGLWREARTQP